MAGKYWPKWDRYAEGNLRQWKPLGHIIAEVFIPCCPASARATRRCSAVCNSSTGYTRALEGERSWNFWIFPPRQRSAIGSSVASDFRNTIKQQLVLLRRGSCLGSDQAASHEGAPPDEVTFPGGASAIFPLKRTLPGGWSAVRPSANHRTDPRYRASVGCSAVAAG